MHRPSELKQWLRVNKALGFEATRIIYKDMSIDLARLSKSAVDALISQSTSNDLTSKRKTPRTLAQMFLTPMTQTSNPKISKTHLSEAQAQASRTKIDGLAYVETITLRNRDHRDLNAIQNLLQALVLAKNKTDGASPLRGIR